MHRGILKTELLSFGIRIPMDRASRKGGAGPAEGGTVLFENSCAMVPLASDYVKRSPYSLQETGSSSILVKDGEEICPIAFVPTPNFYGSSTETGVSYKQIALLHGKDCLASTVYQDCIYWNTPARCAFCGIRLSLDSGQTVKEKTGDQLAEVAAQAQTLDGVTHITLTTGTVNNADKGIVKLAACASAIKKRTALPIHVQFEPPTTLNMLEVLVESGVDTVGIHIESFDREVRARITPAKEAIGEDRFVETWKRAVELFGRNQVSTFVIAGLGEKPLLDYRGKRPGGENRGLSFCGAVAPDSRQRSHQHYTAGPEQFNRYLPNSSSALKKHNLSAQASKAGCVLCGACSALPEFEHDEK